jgi:ubiquinone/menaquinone biosynthesis C-methylase UbiE
MSLWGRVFAAGYDRFMAPVERTVLGDHRRELLAGVSGRVIEIGGGTGANLPYYGEGVSELEIVEPAEPMARRLEAKLEGTSIPVRVVRAAAESLPFPDGSFDWAVATLVLCTVTDPDRAVRELRRLLVPGGRLVFLEHVRAEEPGLARWQDRFDFLQFRLGHGCHCNRPTLDTIRDGGFSVLDVEHDRIRRALPILRPLVAGTAQVT